MNEILQGFFACLLGSMFFACIIAAASARNSGRHSRDEEVAAARAAVSKEAR
ncbi:hypothetical protein EVC10_056 [Rhizobium phage RHph_Y25]|nr:hypothetical protein EVC10_056 [Rhizobium phage RHph_Y25]